MGHLTPDGLAKLFEPVVSVLQFHQNLMSRLRGANDGSLTNIAAIFNDQNLLLQMKDAYTNYANNYIESLRTFVQLKKTNKHFSVSWYCNWIHHETCWLTMALACVQTFLESRPKQGTRSLDYYMYLPKQTM